MIQFPEGNIRIFGKAMGGANSCLFSGKREGLLEAVSGIEEKKVVTSPG